MQLLGHRYYDAALGRFLNPDPIGFAGGLNLYAYCFGNPVGLVDPSGLDGIAFMFPEGVGKTPEERAPFIRGSQEGARFGTTRAAFGVIHDDLDAAARRVQL